MLSVCALYVYFTSKIANSPLFGPVLFFLGVLFTYTIFSYDFNHSWNIFFNRVVKFSMLALFLSVFVRTPWALKMVVGAFLLAMLKLGQEGFAGWLTGGLVWQNQGIMRLHGSMPMYEHPNSFSGMAVGCLPFIYYLFPVVSRFYKVILLILLAFCAVIIVFTGSRTGYIATFGLVVIFFIKHHGKNRWPSLVLLTSVIVVATFLVPPDYKDRFQSAFTGREKEGASKETRIEIMIDAFAVYSANPLGVGVGAFPLVRQKMFNRSQDTHNLYLELLTNLGPLGLLAFVILIYKILLVNLMARELLQKEKGAPHVFLIAVSNAIHAFILARLFLGLFGMDTYEIYWWFAIGITNAVWTASKNIDNFTLTS